MMPGLELAPVIENQFNRLPWCHRASPSTTRYESVKSTDADRLMQTLETVKIYFGPKTQGLTQDWFGNDCFWPF
jgi:hypothetical protein